MFETSVIQGQARVAKSRLSVLTISIIAHSAVVVGVIAASVATVDFPVTAPDEFAQSPFILPVLVPPPLGNPNGGAAKPAEPVKSAAPAPQPQPQPNQITAPSTVPDDLRAVEATPSGPSTGTGIPGATSTEPLGSLDGKPGSVGDLGNVGEVVPTTPVAEKIYEAHEVKAPVGVYRPAPPYPQILLRAKVPATVVVRCVIDKNGRVRDPQITLPARMAPFNEAVIATVQQWRFTPGSLNGEAVETYLSLTVHFSVK
jgi:periplasmic protein TonB